MKGKKIIRLTVEEYEDSLDYYSRLTEENKDIVLEIDLGKTGKVPKNFNVKTVK